MPRKDKRITLDDIKQETQKLVVELSSVAKAPVSIQLIAGDAIAFTHGCDDKRQQHHIPIYMNPSILDDVRNKAQAIKIWWGIGYHELAHHLYPADAQYKIARREGFQHLFNLIDDEHNERQGRAHNAEWGACFQAVCAHVFSTKKQEKGKLSTGVVDGKEEGAKPVGAAAHNIYQQRWNQFALHFRRHIPNAKDPLVAQALNMIPKRFKDLSKEELLDLTRRIHHLFSTGVELTQQDLDDLKAAEEAEKEEEKKEPEPPQPPSGKTSDEDDEEGPAPVTVDTGWSLTRLLTSRWTWAAFLAFIVAWSAFLLRGGVNFWVQVAILSVFLLAGMTIFLFLRRAFIKSLLSRAAAAVSPIIPSMPAPQSVLEKAGKFFSNPKVILGLKVAGSLTLAYGLWRFALVAGYIAAFLLIEVVWLSVCARTLLSLTGTARREKLPINRRQLKLGLAAATFGLICMMITLASAYRSGAQILIGVTYFLVLLVVFPFSTWCMIMLMFLALPDNWMNESVGGKSRVERIKESITQVPSKTWDSIWFGGTWLWTTSTNLIMWLGGRVYALLKWVCNWTIVPLFKLLTRIAVLTYRACRNAYWRVQPSLYRLWQQPLFRLALVALPIAILLVITYSIGVTADKVDRRLMLLLMLLLFLLLLLGYYFRNKIKNFIINELLIPMPELMNVSLQPPLDMENEWFVQIHNIQPVAQDTKVFDELLLEVHALGQQLRPHLENCGRQTVDREDQAEGYDLTDEAETALVGETTVFVDDDSVPRASLHIEVALDCSSSMTSATASLKPGEKFELGKKFALVLEQAVLNMPGVSAKFWGFTSNVIYDCGIAGEGRVSGLQCGGGNNDAAMLWHMGQSARNSGKDIKILLVLSDGQPSDCSWLSLHNLVLQFEQEGMIPWNFGLDVIKTSAFERYFTDLVGQSMEQAIITMGETLATIAQGGD